MQLFAICFYKFSICDAYLNRTIFNLISQVSEFCNKTAKTSKLFRKQILDKCQKEFETTNTDEDEISKFEAKVEEAPAEEKEQLRAELEYKKQQSRRRSLGNVRFIGELYKLHMLTPKIMVACVSMLIGK